MKSYSLEAVIQVLMESSLAALEKSDSKNTVRVIFDAGRKLLGAASGYVALLSQDGSADKVLFPDHGRLSHIIGPDLPEPVRVLHRRAYNTGKAVFHNDLAVCLQAEYIPEGHEYISNVLFAPLVIYGKAIGLLGLANKPGDFTEYDSEIAAAFAELAALALHNSRTRQSLENGRDLFRTIAEVSNDGIITIDSGGNISYCSAGAENIFGYSSEELLGRPFDMVIPEKFHPVYKKVLNQVLFSNKSKIVGKTIELTGRKKNGGEFPVEFSLARWKTHDSVLLAGIIRDITGSKRTELAIKEAKIEWEMTFDSSTELMLLVDKNLFITRCNRSFARFAGKMPKDLIGHNMLDYFPYDPGRSDEIKRQISERAITNMDIKTETGQWFHINHQPLPDREGNSNKAIIIATDITALKSMNQKLIESEENLKKRVTELENFYEMAVNRELRMIELKNNITKLKTRLSKYEKVTDED